MSNGFLSCLFGFLGIFMMGWLFVPFAALFCLFGVIGSVVNLRFGELALCVGAVLTITASILSPSVWLEAAAFLAAK
jgi:hypothetical protein